MRTLPEDTMPAFAKITAKGQATILRNVRTALGGSRETWSTGRWKPMVRPPCARCGPWIRNIHRVEGTLSGWTGAADEKAYRDL